MPKYRLVIFDSDGTLADTLPWMRSVFNEFAAAHGLRKIDPEKMDRYRDLHGGELLTALGVPIWKLPRLAKAMRERMAEEASSFALFPGVAEMLHGLSARGVLLAIVSSNSRGNVERVLGPELAGLIARYECGVALLGKGAKLRAVVRAMKVEPADAIYVGDEIRDAEAARQAGIAFGAVAWGQCSAKALRAQKPQDFFRSVEELAALAVNVAA